MLLTERPFPGEGRVFWLAGSFSEPELCPPPWPCLRVFVSFVNSLSCGTVRLAGAGLCLQLCVCQSLWFVPQSTCVSICTLIWFLSVCVCYCEWLCRQGVCKSLHFPLKIPVFENVVEMNNWDQYWWLQDNSLCLVWRVPLDRWIATPLFLITKTLTLGIPWTSNKSDPPFPYCTDQETGTKRGNDLIRLTKGPGTGTKVSWLTSAFSTLGPISGTLWHRNQHVKTSVWDTALESTISPTFFNFSFLLDSFFSHFSLSFYSISPLSSISILSFPFFSIYFCLYLRNTSDTHSHFLVVCGAQY